MKKLLYPILAGLLLIACGDEDVSDIQKYDMIRYAQFDSISADDVKEMKKEDSSIETPADVLRFINEKVEKDIIERKEKAEKKGKEMPTFMPSAIYMEAFTANELKNKVTAQTIQPYEAFDKSLYKGIEFCGATVGKRESLFIIAKKPKKINDVCSMINVGTYKGHNYSYVSKKGKDRVEIEGYRMRNSGRIFSAYENNDNSIVSVAKFPSVGHFEGIRTPVKFIDEQNGEVIYQGYGEKPYGYRIPRPIIPKAIKVTVDFHRKTVKFKMPDRAPIFADIKGNQFMGKIDSSERRIIRGFYGANARVVTNRKEGRIIGGFYGANASSLVFFEVGNEYIRTYGLADKVSNNTSK